MPATTHYPNHANPVSSQTSVHAPRTSSASWLRGVAGMFAAEGVDVPALFAQAGLDHRALDNPEARFPADTISLLWELAVARSGKPQLGLRRALAASHGNLGEVGFAMLSSATLLDGLERLARYLAVVSDAATLQLQPDARGHWLVMGHVGATRPVPRQRVEFGQLTLLMLCGWLTRRELQPMAVEFVFAAPPCDLAHREAFACAVRFGQPVNRMLLCQADLQAPIPTGNSALSDMHERLVAGRLDDLGQRRIGQRVRDTIAQRLPGGEPRREDVAVALGLTDRTLQRRLQAEALSFQQVLDATRRELAAQYLADDRLALVDVADRLGFAEVSNFFRACRRWFGEPPGRYRERVFASALQRV